MSSRLQQYAARVLSRERLSEHLVRLALGGPGLAGFSSTGVPDEWLALVVPGQFQSRYYTVRRWDGSRLTLDVVLHEVGGVTTWAARDRVGDMVTVSEPRGSSPPPAAPAWVHLVGDLTALPAMARTAEVLAAAPVRIWAETGDDLPGYFPASAQVTWLAPPRPGESRLAAVVEGLPWPPGDGYFWMAGESAQMRAVRSLLRRERRGTAYAAMGYWRAVTARPTRSVDPAPLWRAARAAGLSDAQAWAAYDAAHEADS